MTQEPVSISEAAVKVTRHGARRLRLAQNVPLAVRPTFPGVTMLLKARTGHPVRLDLSKLHSRALSMQIGRIIWDSHLSGTFPQTRMTAHAITVALRDLDAVLEPIRTSITIDRLEQLSAEMIDKVELRTAARLVDPNQNATLMLRMSNFVRLLQEAKVAGIPFDASTSERITYACRSHAFTHVSKPRDCYPDEVWDQVLSAAKAEVLAAIERARLRWRLHRSNHSHSSQSALTAELAQLSQPSTAMIQDGALVNPPKGQYWSLEALQLAYLDSGAYAPFCILLMHAVDLPPECIRELRADCIRDPWSKAVTAKFYYVKRRAHGGETPRSVTVKMRGIWSAGWLVRRLLDITAIARHQLGYTANNGPLLIRRSQRRINAFHDTTRALQYFLARNPQIVTSDDKPLEKLSLARIRKTIKAKKWKATGGELTAMPTDHTQPVLYSSYLRIGGLQPLHREIARVVARGHFERHVNRKDRHEENAVTGLLAADGNPASVALVPVARAASDGQIGIVCIDPYRSPYQPAGQICSSAPRGCLGCGNAIYGPTFVPVANALCQRLTNAQPYASNRQLAEQASELLRRLGQDDDGSDVRDNSDLPA